MVNLAIVCAALACWLQVRGWLKARRDQRRRDQTQQDQGRWDQQQGAALVVRVPLSLSPEHLCQLHADLRPSYPHGPIVFEPRPGRRFQSERQETRDGRS